MHGLSRERLFPYVLIRHVRSACMLIRRSAFDRIGPLDPTLPVTGFIEMPREEF